MILGVCAGPALMRLDHVETLPALRRHLGAADPFVRTFAAWGMRQPLDSDSVGALGELLGDPGSQWQSRVQALESLRGSPSGTRSSR